jgi:hypothetical protein
LAGDRKVIIAVLAPPVLETTVGLGGRGTLGSAASIATGLAGLSPQPTSAISAASAQILVGIIGRGD